MDVLIITHADFVMTISFKEEGGEKEFRKIYDCIKAKYKGGSFSTKYIFSDPDLLQEFSLCDLSEKLPVNKDIDRDNCPVLFENKKYRIRIEFLADIKRPYIFSRDKSLTDAFDYRMVGGITPFLFTDITFRNDIGYIDFNINYTRGTIDKTVVFKARVFSEKFDIDNGLPIITRDIELFYPRLILDHIKKTYHHFDIVPGEYNNLTWWVIFENTYKKLITDFEFIIEKPHRKQGPYKVLKRRDKIYNPTAYLAEKIKRYAGEADKYFLVWGQKDLEDNYENQVVKFILKDILHKFKKIYELVKGHSAGKRMTIDYKDQLDFVYGALQSLLNHSFFQSVRDINEIKRTSHVLTMRSGYADLLRDWEKLNMGYKLFEGVLELELKDIAYLYQIWCFFGMIDLIKSLGGEIVEIVKVPFILPDQFILYPDKDMNSKILFKFGDGTMVELYHELLYSDKFDKDNAGSLTGSVRPDIVLRVKKNDLQDTPFITYLFDVKYKLDESVKGDMRQVHHYRDAIHNKNQYTNLLSKEVKGAYIIHPGKEKPGNQRNLDLIDAGLFSFIPGEDMENSMLRNHLAKIIYEGGITLLKDVPPQKGKSYQSDESFVLIHFIRKDNAAEIHYFEDTYASLLCHKSFIRAVGNNSLRYVAINIEGKGIKYMYEILDYNWKSRRQVYPPDHELFVDNGRKHLVLRIGNKKVFEERLQIKGTVSSSRYTKMAYINNPVNGFIKTVPKEKLS